MPALRDHLIQKLLKVWRRDFNLPQSVWLFSLSSIGQGYRLLFSLVLAKLIIQFYGAGGFLAYNSSQNLFNIIHSLVSSGTGNAVIVTIARAKNAVKATSFLLTAAAGIAIFYAISLYGTYGIATYFGHGDLLTQILVNDSVDAIFDYRLFAFFILSSITLSVGTFFQSTLNGIDQRERLLLNALKASILASAVALSLLFLIALPVLLIFAVVNMLTGLFLIIFGIRSKAIKVWRVALDLKTTRFVLLSSLMPITSGLVSPATILALRSLIDDFSLNLAAQWDMHRIFGDILPMILIGYLVVGALPIISKQKSFAGYLNYTAHLSGNISLMFLVFFIPYILVVLHVSEFIGGKGLAVGWEEFVIRILAEFIRCLSWAWSLILISKGKAPFYIALSLCQAFFIIGFTSYVINSDAEVNVYALNEAYLVANVASMILISIVTGFWVRRWFEK